MKLGNWLAYRKNRSVWTDPVRRFRTLQSFSETEEDGGKDLIAAARRISDPDLRSHIERHAEDEVRHASLFRNRADVSVLMDEIVDLDLAGRAVVSRGARYGYDYLVLAAGSEYAYFGRDGWRERSLALKTLEEALEMRERILLAFERAEMAADEAERRRLMTFVIIGGGPTGVELAGAIAELARSALARDFRRIVPGEAEILLLEAGPALLADFPKRLSDFAAKALQRKGTAVDRTSYI